MYRRALEIREKTLGGEHPDVAASLNNLANLLQSQARYADAEPLYQRALSVMEKARGEEHPEVAFALNNLAALYNLEGRYRDAEPLYRRALEVSLKNFGPDHASVAQCQNNLAHMFEDQGDLAQAETLYREALQTGEHVHGPDHPKVAATLSNLARTLTSAERFDEAEPLFQRALEIENKAGSANSPDAAEYRKNLGNLLLLEDRFDEAQAAYTQALTDIETAAGKDHPVAASTLHGMAMLSLAKQDLTKAEEFQNRAYMIRRKNFSEAFGVLAERNALENSQFLQTEASNYLSILLATPDGESANREEIAKVVFSTKGLVTDGIFVRHKSVSAIAALVDSLNQARIALSKLYVEGADPARAWAYQMDIQKANEKKERFEAELARSGTGFRGEKFVTQVDAKKVASQLAPGTALVEFMRYEHCTSLNSREPRYLAVVVKSNGKAAAYTLGSVAEIDSAVAKYRRHMANVRALNVDEYTALCYDLYRLIWQPFEIQVSGLNAVFLSPDGALCLVSFAGLKSPDGDYLIERSPIHYVASGRDLVREEQVTAVKGSGLLALGDPDYDATPAVRSGKSEQSSMLGTVGGMMGLTRGGTSSCRALRDMVVGRLPATRAEVDEVAARWKSANPEPATELFDAQATEDAFKKQSPGSRVLHLATHGYYISNECKPDKATNVTIGESPLLQSGLFFAGANLKGAGAAEAGVEDGTLTAEEVAGLNLSSTELVVLSACETGLGEVRTGEGVFGLRRAFQMAGAKTVISALWPVDDKSTAELMGSLFASHDGNLYDAMRKSALEAIKSRRAAGKSDHPFYWAGFIATGDWAAR